MYPMTLIMWENTDVLKNVWGSYFYLANKRYEESRLFINIEVCFCYKIKTELKNRVCVYINPNFFNGGDTIYWPKCGIS